MTRVLLPGDRLPSTSAASAATTLHLGPGLQSVVVPSSYKGKSKATSDAMDTDEKPGKEAEGGEEDEEVVANRAGLLGMQEDNKSQKYWIEGTSRRSPRTHRRDAMMYIWLAPSGARHASSTLRISAARGCCHDLMLYGVYGEDYSNHDLKCTFNEGDRHFLPYKIVVAQYSELTKRSILLNLVPTFIMQYIPQAPEPVIGIIIARHAEGYRVDIGSSQAASLDALAFEGATKRNKPNLKVGTLVYGHLLATPPFSEPEISCVDAATQKAAGFGELAGGFLIRHVELGRCRALLSPKHPILERLGAQFAFEIAVGMNGRVWVKAGDDDTEKLIAMIAELRGDE
ncbi:BZ3500_MvSof-1268-A1-R1_Chr9g10715 [Microbotryum saponariae]|uniref:Ribosomal RNA-processing protein 40 n=1 Tax=Microbotryum saponariae TaxID=289078 RepID=A0A2X0LVK4_9BASI|nr:BZ3501_MvSof-1269-A2-R1_Chr9g10463 [Microbotryum saponariae]SDA00575.1 BZ3500_MvSof-1268-A1-R1_Chr9g10715 [Microbotryum saponariae]